MQLTVVVVFDIVVVVVVFVIFIVTCITLPLPHLTPGGYCTVYHIGLYIVP